jgi:hypothetical protein
MNPKMLNSICAEYNVTKEIDKGYERMAELAEIFELCHISLTLCSVS